MNKKILILLCIILSVGLIVNGNVFNEKKTNLAEDIPYEWIIINNGGELAEDIPYEWSIINNNNL